MDDAGGDAGELGEGVLEEVEVVALAFGALIDDLGCVRVALEWRGEGRGGGGGT